VVVITSLPDGTRVLVRPIRPEDKDLLANGLRRLSERTVQRRFLSPKPRFSQAELRYLTEVDGENHVALVAEVVGPEGAGMEPYDRLGAVARFVRLPDEPETAEAAIVVADCHQGQGLGTQLALRLADAARTKGIRRFSATIASDNVPAQRLMQKISRRLGSEPVQRSRSGSVDDLLTDLAA
jgi:RimJ/RimL family protein N-acetyltransferase